MCAIHNPSCFSRCLRVPIAMRRFYKHTLCILEYFRLTNPHLHPGLLASGIRHDRTSISFLRTSPSHRTSWAHPQVIGR
jgi:hypothetical protein